MQLRGGDEEGGLSPQQEGQAGQGALLIICGHMGHQGQVLHQATALPLWGVCWAQHAPLAGLQSPRTTHLHRGRGS